MDETPAIPSAETDTNDETRPLTFHDSLQDAAGKANAIITRRLREILLDPEKVARRLQDPVFRMGHPELYRYETKSLEELPKELLFAKRMVNGKELELAQARQLVKNIEARIDALTNEQKQEGTPANDQT